MEAGDCRTEVGGQDSGISIPKSAIRIPQSPHTGRPSQKARRLLIVKQSAARAMVQLDGSRSDRPNESVSRVVEKVIVRIPEYACKSRNLLYNLSTYEMNISDLEINTEFSFHLQLSCV